MKVMIGSSHSWKVSVIKTYDGKIWKMQVLAESLITETGINISEKYKDNVNERNTSHLWPLHCGL